MRSKLSLIPSIPAVLGNFLIPLMIGARDLAFPKLNLLSWYIYMLGGIITIYALLAGGVDTGWTFYTPYSTTFSNSYVTASRPAPNSSSVAASAKPAWICRALSR